ncbi:MAG: methyltransferase domain-containing protein [Candidatus Omnitrophica bacterium]|nr:methyltransferase domain-containing protein [Candidatus Omnitrophota bacterium]MBI2496111.1 methyltransferase domain-containing protein [Candidatus Omnitrophota bacterium]MBI3021341.1 methyltransferase domain-containing protein [Candidatus Omnitrophota bacterium]MBI3083887.1 methyltransferase domain-containing protein [Candidatus Omnitrophota bacterium]
MAQATGEGRAHAQTVRHFGHLAGTYDRRHHRYNQLTLSRAIEALRLSGAERLLDVGCGTGELERLLRERYPDVRLVGIDVTPQMLAVAREKFRKVLGVAFLLAQAEALPFAMEGFDAVVSCNMLHHVRSADDLLRECARVLRPRGRIVLVDWCRDAWQCRLAHYWLRLVKRSYVKMYRAAEVVELAAPLGLAVEDVSRFFVPPYFGMMRVVLTRQ